METDLLVDVIDSGGAALPGAVGTLNSSVLTGAKTSLSDADGRIRFLGLPPGDFELIVTMEGFETAQEDNIPLRRDEPRMITITLQLADVDG